MVFILKFKKPIIHVLSEEKRKQSIRIVLLFSFKMLRFSCFILL